MSMKGQGHVPNGPKDGVDNDDFSNSWRAHAQGYGQPPMSTSAPLNDPYGYYGASFQTYQPAAYAPGDHNSAAWSNGDPSMTFLSGYGGHQPTAMGHDSYTLDGMFGPSSFGGFGQPNFGYGFHGNNEYHGGWGALGRTKYDDYYRDPYVATTAAPVGTNAAPGSMATNHGTAPGSSALTSNAMDFDRNVRSMEHSMGALNFGTAPGTSVAPPHPPPSTVVSTSSVEREKPVLNNGITTAPPPTAHPSHAAPGSGAPQSKKMTWASIASQPAKPVFKGRTKQSSSPGLPIGPWDTKGAKSGVIPPPPAPRPSAWGARAPPPSQPPPLSPTSSTLPAFAGNAAAFPPPQAAVSPPAPVSAPQVTPPASHSPPVTSAPPPAPPASSSHNEPMGNGAHGHVGQNHYSQSQQHQASASYNNNSGGSSSNANHQGLPTQTQHQQHSPPPPQQQQQQPASPTGQHSSYSNGPSDAEQDASSYPALDPLMMKSNYNPKDFDLNPKGARYFVIKSYSEDDIHRSIKYEIWCSTEHGNKRLDQAFRERENKGPIFLFYSVNGSGHFCGMAQMLSSVDYNTSASVWAQDKWKGSFKVKWIYVKDVPNAKFRHIRLENNENKPVTNSRDTQEVPPEKGKMVLKELHAFKHTTSIFDDFIHYEQRQIEEEERRHLAPAPNSHPPQALIKDDGGSNRDRRRRDDHHRDRDAREVRDHYPRDRDRDHRDRDHRDRDREHRDYRDHRDHHHQNHHDSRGGGGGGGGGEYRGHSRGGYNNRS